MRLPSGKWFAIREINNARTYTWFGAVAGVRTRDIAPIAPVRGMPADASDTWVQYCNGDIESGFLHNVTWLTPSEVAEANRLYSEQRKNWLEGDTLTPEQIAVPHEPVPQMSDEVSELHVGYTYDGSYGYPGNASVIKWAGTIKDLVGEEAIYEESIRYCIAFDN